MDFAAGQGGGSVRGDKGYLTIGVVAFRRTPADNSSRLEINTICSTETAATVGSISVRMVSNIFFGNVMLAPARNMATISSSNDVMKARRLIAFAWNWSFGQISRALNVNFQSLPDWKALFYIALVLLLLYMAYLMLPRILIAIVAIFRAIWVLVETLVGIAVDMVWYVLIAYGIALAMNTFKVGALIGKMPWQ